MEATRAGEQGRDEQELPTKCREQGDRFVSVGASASWVDT